VYFDILNHLGVDHECDRQTDRQTDRQPKLRNDMKSLRFVLRANVRHLSVSHIDGRRLLTVHLLIHTSWSWKYKVLLTVIFIMCTFCTHYVLRNLSAHCKRLRPACARTTALLCFCFNFTWHNSCEAQLNIKVKRLRQISFWIQFWNCSETHIVTDWQSCKTFIGLTNRAKMIGGDGPCHLKFWIKLTAFERNCRFSISFRS